MHSEAHKLPTNKWPYDSINITMSYDISLFRKLEGKTVQESAAEVLESDVNSLDPVSFSEQRKNLSERLMEENPSFKKNSSDTFTEFTDIETGIQIDIDPNQVSVSVPYWHNDAEAKQVFADVLRYLEIIQKETGYSIYDPQTEREIQLNGDVGQFLNTYSSTIELIAKTPIHLKETPRVFSSNTVFALFGVILILWTVIAYMRR